MELEIKRERINDSVSKRRAAGKDLGGRRQEFSDSQIRNARRLIEAGEPATQVARDLNMSRATLYRRIAELDARDWIAATKQDVAAGLDRDAGQFTTLKDLSPNESTELERRS